MRKSLTIVFGSVVSWIAKVWCWRRRNRWRKVEFSFELKVGEDCWAEVFDDGSCSLQVLEKDIPSKSISILSLLLLSATIASAQLTNITFRWDASPYATGYRFYDSYGTNRVLLGITTGLTFTVTNWSTSTSRTVSVTANNMILESDETVLIVPPAPGAVQNLKPVPLSIVSPVPGVIELSQDLADWTQRIRLAAGPTNSIQLTWVQYPKEPMMFMRQRAAPLLLPPLPTSLRKP